MCYGIPARWHLKLYEFASAATLEPIFFERHHLIKAVATANDVVCCLYFRALHDANLLEDVGSRQDDQC